MGDHSIKINALNKKNTWKQPYILYKFFILFFRLSLQEYYKI